MSERWVSQGRKFCRFCNCWYADNKVSIESHERGASHQANVERDLNKARRNKEDLAAAEAILANELQRAEAAALRSLEEDARRDQFAKDELERVRQARTTGPQSSIAGPSRR